MEATGIRGCLYRSGRLCVAGNEGGELLRIRILSAIILLPIVVLLFFLGGWPYRLLVAVVMLLAGFEYSRMFRRIGYRLSILLIALTTLAWEVDAIWPDQGLFLPIIALVIMAMTIWELVQARGRPQEEHRTEQWALLLAGASYLGIGGAYLIRLRALEDGLWWLLTACIIVWVSDSAAYFVGRRWGQHKMAPTISPGKSWEGYIGQVISGPLIGMLMGWLGPLLASVSTLNVWRGLLLGIVISALSPAGDFFISMMKRQVNVKDTSQLIPGHGGILDRIDSILWAAMLGSLVARLTLI